MNSFSVDELMLSFDELKPFSEVLHDDIQLYRLHKLYKNLDKHDDDALLRHILVVVSCMEDCLHADPPLLKMLQNCLVEMTSLIEKSKETASRNLISIATGILFKYSAALLQIQENTDFELALFLNAVAYHYLSSASSAEADVSAWIALHTLEAGAAITYGYVVENEDIELCSRDDLAEFCVDSLIPSDGRIQRLHAGVFCDAIAAAPTVWPTITVMQIRKMFERLIPVLNRPDVLRIIVWMIGHDSTFEELSLFDSLIMRSSTLNKSNDLDSPNLTGIDVKCFLFTLSLWSDSTTDPAVVPARLRIRADQNNCWRAICQSLCSNSGSENVKSVLLRSRVIDSVRLRHRVVSLRRLYEVFRWLETHIKNHQWLMLYATAINEVITGAHSHRRKCDDLFPDGADDDAVMSVDEVDRIEEHVSRYIATQHLSRNEFTRAEHLLIYANSFDSKKLLLKVYRKWLEEGDLDKQERDHLSKRVRELEIECCEEDLRGHTPSTNSVASVTSGGETVASAIPPGTRKNLVDACTNTPSRVDTSTSCGDDASFFSAKSDRSGAVMREESFASAIASPADSSAGKPPLFPTSRILPTSSPTGYQDHATQYPDGGTYTSATSFTPSAKPSDAAYPGSTAHPQLTATNPVAVSSPSVIVQNPAVPIVPNITASPIPIVVSKSPFGPPVINKEAAASFWKSGKSGGAHPFTLGNKPGANAQPTTGFAAIVPPVSGPATTAAPAMQSPFGILQPAHPPVGLAKPAVVPGVTTSGSIIAMGGSAQGLNIPSSASPLPTATFMNSPSSAPQLNIPHPTVLTNVPSSLPQTTSGFGSSLLKPAGAKPATPNAETGFPASIYNNNSPLTPANVSAVSGKDDNDDELFYNDLMIELCRKQLERTGKKLSGKEAPLEDMHSLQQRLAEIERQMKKVESQIHVDTNTPPVTFSTSVTTRKAPTPAEIVRQHQREALVELEQQVAQHVNPVAKQPIGTVSSSTADSDNKSAACTDPMNLFRGLLMSNSGDSLNTSKPNAPAANKTALSTDSTPFAQSSRDPLNNPLFKMEQMARHPGSVGVCLGCLDDDSQDRALLALTRLSEQWNAETDSDSDD